MARFGIRRRSWRWTAGAVVSLAMVVGSIGVVQADITEDPDLDVCYRTDGRRYVRVVDATEDCAPNETRTMMVTVLPDPSVALVARTELFDTVELTEDWTTVIAMGPVDPGQYMAWSQVRFGGDSARCRLRSGEATSNIAYFGEDLNTPSEVRDIMIANHGAFFVFGPDEERNILVECKSFDSSFDDGTGGFATEAQIMLESVDAVVVMDGRTTEQPEA